MVISICAFYHFSPMRTCACRDSVIGSTYVFGLCIIYYIINSDYVIYLDESECQLPTKVTNAARRTLTPLLPVAPTFPGMVRNVGSVGSQQTQHPSSSNAYRRPERHVINHDALPEGAASCLINAVNDMFVPNLQGVYTCSLLFKSVCFVHEAMNNISACSYILFKLVRSTMLKACANSLILTLTMFAIFQIFSTALKKYNTNHYLQHVIQ